MKLLRWIAHQVAHVFRWNDVRIETVLVRRTAYHREEPWTFCVCVGCGEIHGKMPVQP